jgi:DNA-binding response OmpR family regulator
MTQQEINQKAEEFELTNGIYGFKEGVKWACKWLLKKPEGYIFDTDKQIIEHNGVSYRLQKKNYQVAKFLYDNRNRIVNRDEIYANVWDGVIVEERTIDIHIKKIRTGVPGIPIQTIKGVGLIWND